MIQSLSVIIPAYNEADRIVATIRDVLARVPTLTHAFEIIVIDDGSTDTTADVVVAAFPEEVSQGVLRVKSISHAGKGGAVRIGIFLAKQEWVLFMDADNATSISELLHLLPYTNEYPIIIGSRALPASGIERQEFWVRKAIGTCFNWLVRHLAQLPFFDTQCGFKLFKKQVAQTLFQELWNYGFVFDVEVLARAHAKGIPIKEVAVNWQRSARSSVHVVREAIRMFFALVQIRYRLMTKKERSTKRTGALFLILLVGIFVYRSSVITHSLPDGTLFGHTRSYFQDEDAVVADTARLIAAVRQNPLNIFDPGPTVYPVFGGILSTLPLGFVYLLQYRGLDVGSLMTASPQAQAMFYTQIALIGRWISFFAAFASILLFYRLARELKINERIAAFIAVIYAWLPIDILMSIEAKTNALLNFLLLLIVYLCVRWLHTKEDRLILFASLTVGLAVGTRLNGLLGAGIIFFTLAFAYRGQIWKFFTEKPRRVTLFLLPFVGLLLSSPHLLAHPKYIARMWSRAGSGSLLWSIDVASQNILHTLKFLAGGWVGFSLFIFSIGIAVYAIKKWSLAHKVVASWFLLYLFIFTQTSVPIIRYAYPLLPVWLLLFGSFCSNVLLRARPWPRRLIWGIVSVWGLTVLPFSLAYLSMLQDVPLQYMANKYVEDVIPRGRSIGTYFNAEFYNRVPINYEKYTIFSCRDLEEGVRTLADFNTTPDYLEVPVRGVDCMERIFHTSKAYSLMATFTRPLTFGPWTFDVNGAGAYRPTPIIVYERL